MRTRKSRKALNCDMGKNLKMNDEVYAMRREVMNYIYDAKNLLRANGHQLPRIEVRITDNTGKRGHAAGMGRMGCNIVWISTMCLRKWKGHVRQVTFHEILHAVLATQHDDDCPLMKPFFDMKPLSDADVDKHFLKYFQ